LLTPDWYAQQQTEQEKKYSTDNSNIYLPAIRTHEWIEINLNKFLEVLIEQVFLAAREVIISIFSLELQ